MKAYSTYVLGKDAILAFNLPSIKMPKGKKVKETIKQKVKRLETQNTQNIERISKLAGQLHEQNLLTERVQREGNQLVDKYNKLAGKINSIRTLVTTD